MTKAGSRFVIAIDGPSGAGKGTLAKALSRHYEIPHLDTGLIYRAAALAAVEYDATPAACGIENHSKSASNEEKQDGILEIARAVDVSKLCWWPTATDTAAFDAYTIALRSEKIALKASEFAACSAVRSLLLTKQRTLLENIGSLVLDGRDTTTVVCPSAKYRLFVTASAEVRATRRRDELISRGTKANYADVLQSIVQRDERDTRRSDAPLRIADGAIVIDTSEKTSEQAFNCAVDYIECSA